MQLKRTDKLSLVFGVLALFFGAYIFTVLPHDKALPHIGIFLFKLLPFALAALSISLFDPHIAGRLKLTIFLVYGCFALFFFYYVPKIFFDIAFMGAGKVYYLTLMMVPAFILSLALAFRLGGGSTGNTLRIAFGSLALMLSGLEDLLFMILNPHQPGRFNPVPEVWDWTEHIRVRLGHYPSKAEAYLFIACHVALAVFIALHHFRWLGKISRVLQR